MKKVRIDWNRVQEPWIPARNLTVGTNDFDLLPLLKKQSDKISLLRCVLQVEDPKKDLDFLKQASSCAQEVLLCLDGGYTLSSHHYETVILPILNAAVESCPNLHYIEIGNEAERIGISAEQYYSCYRGAYHALAKINHPLKLGGNGVDRLLNHADFWLSFLQNLANDTDPQKRIDFYSFHEALSDYPVRIWLAHEAHIAWLKEFHLPTLPIFLDSLCLTEKDALIGGRELNQRNAATMISAAIAATEWPEFRLFFKSALDPVFAHTQFEKTESGFLHTANAHANEIISSLTGERLVCDIIEESWPPQKDIVAVKNNGRLSVVVCNPTDEPTYIKFTVADIPYPKLKIHKYLVDDRNNANGLPLCLTDGIYQAPQKIKNTENVEMLGGADTREELEGTITLECNLREHAFCLWTFESYA